MSNVWITYAWDDNIEQQVDFIAQELRAAGLHVMIDKWDLVSGRRLWEQIGDYISDPSQTDAWILIATQNSLGSEACKEEFYTAHERALRQRDTEFPIIPVFLGRYDRNLLPPMVRSRLAVSIQSNSWVREVVDGVHGKNSASRLASIPPFFLKVYDGRDTMEKFAPLVIEMRPRTGTWAPFFFAYPRAESEAVGGHLAHGGAGHPVAYGVINEIPQSYFRDDLPERFFGSRCQASPTESFYFWCKSLPSYIQFGTEGGVDKAFHHEFRK